jgi:hypothetical protein
MRAHVMLMLTLFLALSCPYLCQCSYDDEWDTYENDVTATTRGRGPAEAGQINIAIAPNDDSAVSGTVKATAAQGAAVAGVFTLTNAAVEAYQGINVSAHNVEVYMVVKFGAAFSICLLGVVLWALRLSVYVVCAELTPQRHKAQFS